MESNRLQRWLQNIYNTLDEEISCTECFEAVSHYVELEVSGGEPAVIMPKVKQHLSQCAACREEYETLRDLRHLEEKGQTPSADDLKDLIP